MNVTRYFSSFLNETRIFKLAIKANNYLANKLPMLIPFQTSVIRISLTRIVFTQARPDPGSNLLGSHHIPERSKHENFRSKSKARE